MAAAQERKKARHILELTPQEQKDFIDSFDLMLSDCDGVVWLIIEPIAHAGEAVSRLLQAGKQCKFVSNNSMRTDDEYMQKFAAIGVQNIQNNDIMHPVKVMIAYLKKHCNGQRVFSICGSVANQALRDSGIDVETLPVEPDLSVNALVNQVRVKGKVSAVLCDINLSLCYAQLVRAIQYLRDPDCLFITGGTDTHLPVAVNLAVPGFVDFQHYITRYSQRQPIALGKPSPMLGNVLKEIYDIQTPSRCIFVGDAMSQDIVFGIACGFQTLLVLSGATSKEDLLATKPECQPDYYADSLADFVQLFKSLEAANLISASK